MFVEAETVFDPEIMTRRYYSEVAEKIGTLLRRDIMSQEKSPACSLKQQRFRITFLANSLNSLNCSKTPKRASPNFVIQTKKNLSSENRKNLLQFKQKLKQNLAQSRIKKEIDTHELTNRIRWRKSNMKMDKQIRFEQDSTRKKYEVDIMKNILEKSREFVKVVKRQNQLQHTFKCFERRMKINVRQKDKK